MKFGAKTKTLFVACGMFVSFFLLLSFSIVLVFSALETTYSGGFKVYYSPAQTLISGSEFSDLVSKDTLTEIVFDFGIKHNNIVKNSSLTRITVDVGGKGYNNGGISVFFNEDETIAYVLSNAEIMANADCGYMFSVNNGTKYPALSIIQFNNFNTQNTTKMNSMFGDASKYCNLTRVDVSNFDTSNVTLMSCMFDGCKLLTQLDVSNFDTSNVITMQMMFARCHGLTSLDVSNFDTSKADSMGYMFWGLSVTELDVSNFNTSNVRYLDSMFEACTNLTTLNVSSFNTSKAWYMNYMFYGCKSLRSLNLANFNTANVKDMACMFGNCSSLSSINLSSFDTSNVTDMSGMFRCIEQKGNRLTTLDLSSFNTSKVTKMERMFEQRDILTTIYVGSGWSTTAVTDSGTNMFTGCGNLVGGAGTTYSSSNTDKTYARIDGGPSSSTPGYLTMVYGLVTGSTLNSNIPSKCTEITFDYYNNAKTEVENGNYTSVNVAYKTSTTKSDIIKLYTNAEETKCYVLSNILIRANADCSGMFKGKTNLTTINFNNFSTAQATNMYQMFLNCFSLKQLNLSCFNTSLVKNMSYMFYNCEAMESLDVSSFNTEKVTTMAYMFRYCSSITKLDLSNFYTPSLQDTLTQSSPSYSMSGLFFGCANLKELDISNFNTSTVQYLGYIFTGCSSLKELDLIHFNTSKVVDMSDMFNGCSSLEKLNISNWNTSKLGVLSISKAQWPDSMTRMFQDCSSLTELDLSSFDTTNARSTRYMFKGCSKLKTIYASGTWGLNNLFNFANLAGDADMFLGCTSLVGGAGTKYNSSYVNGYYARLDIEGGRNGYFTKK